MGLLAVGRCIGADQPVTQRNNSPMTSQHERNNGERGDSLPRPVCQEPDRSSPKACAMEQLAGNQRKPVGSI